MYKHFELTQTPRTVDSDSFFLADMFDEMYCENSVNTTYPISLQQVVTNPTVNPNPSENPFGGSATLSPFVLSSILLMTLLALVFMN